MSKKITLYKHQNKIVKSVYKAWKKKKKHILVQSATGSGKTVIFSFIASKVSANNKKVLIITDRIELLSQAGGTIESFDMKPFLIKAGTTFIDRTKSIYIGMSQTLRNRLNNPLWLKFIRDEIGLIIVDEAHKQEFNHLFKFEWMEKKFVLGFTATPSRGGKMVQLGVQYETIVYGKSIKWLIKKGYLLNCDIYDCGAPDMSGVAVNKSKMDYSESSMFKQFDNTKLYKGLVKNYNKICKGKKMMVFCCNVEHAIKTTKKLSKAGIPVKFVSSKKTAPKEPKKWTPATEEVYNEKFRAFQLYEKYFYKFSGSRKEVFKWFKESQSGVLVNVDIATTGFDDPKVEVIALYRSTMSLVLYLQMLGRGSRTVKDNSITKTHFTVLDFGNNKSRFGGYDVDRGWSLWHEENKSEGGVPPMKICGEDSKFNKLEGAGKVKEGCGRLIPASLKICPFCGFRAKKLTKIEEVELALSSVVDEKGVSLKFKPIKEMTFHELTEYRKIKKYNIHWLYGILWNRGGEKVLKEYAKEYGWKFHQTRYAIEDCKSRYGE